jgi:hypothetical protein
LIGYILTGGPEQATARIFKALRAVCYLFAPFFPAREIPALKKVSTYLQAAKDDLCHCHAK